MARVLCAGNGWLMRVWVCSFLDDVDRIATRRYEPSDDDVVRARLRTVGVQEYSLKFENVGACLRLSADRVLTL